MNYSKKDIVGFALDLGLCTVVGWLLGTFIGEQRPMTKLVHKASDLVATPALPATDAAVETK